MHRENQHLIQRRNAAMGPAYRLFYEQPIHLVRGEGVWLWDRQGRKYLDCYNNVASVGHCHPRVVDAISRQARALNTHTRYLHENIVRYAERLGASLPGELGICMFACTGTEAVDLAFRIARTVSGHRGAIVTESAYHGNSVAVAELSTMDYPACDRPEYLEAVEAPNGYRGRYRYGDPDLAAGYARLVDEAAQRLASRETGCAMFIYDGIFSSNGILTPPPEYFQQAYRQVRAAGGLVVADEVQSGLCRLGEDMWGFQGSGVIPDIVTMGKPLGDGHPLAAVVTTPAIAEAFAKRFDYFNTFGGNPVSAAAGLAVLDVIEQEGVLENVRRVGAFVRSGLQELADRHECIGDVRGKGLFLGVEIVRDRTNRQADEQPARRIREHLRNNGVLVGATGPLGNVVKIRPPLVFSMADAEILLDRLEEAISGQYEA
jgi:4-aminobutyrate aminotransferase-like enzyme